MFKKYISLVIFASFFTTLISLPSSAVKTIADVLKNKNLPELETYVASLSKQQVIEALQYIDTLETPNWFSEAARDWLLIRLSELDDEEEQSNVDPMDYEDSDGQSSASQQSSSSGGGGGGGGGWDDDSDERPSFVVGGPSGPSIFGHRPSPWNNEAAFLEERLSDLLGQTRVELPHSEQISTDNSGNLKIKFHDVGRMITFNPVDFLREAAAKIQEKAALKQQIEKFLANPKRDHSQTIALCWQAISQLKTEISRKDNLDELPFVFMTMAKIFLATHITPSFEISSTTKLITTDSHESANRLTIYLINHLETFNLDAETNAKPNKTYKWSLIYYAWLSLDYVNRNPASSSRRNFAVKAFNALEKAKTLETTKTVHALLAHLYLEHGSLFGYSPEETASLVDIELGLFYKTNPSTAKAAYRREKEGQKADAFWSDMARPAYFRDNAIQEDIRALLEQVASLGQPGEQERHEVPPTNYLASLLEEDMRSLLAQIAHLTEASAQQGHEDPLHITQMESESAAALPARLVDNRYFLEREADYTLEGHRFTNFNVSGQDFRCFFNSMGLDADEQIQLLLKHERDPRVRAMVANEIVSAWRHYYQLPEALRAQLNARDLHERQARVDRLVESDAQVDLREELKAEQSAILNEFRRRALEIKAYRSFVTHQIGTRIDGEEDAPYPMMVMQQDVRGEEDNDLLNLSAIDAIALVNGVGIRVFSIQGDNLKPIHSFIPPNARAVAHLIYSPQSQHFTALVPSDDLIDLASEENHADLDARIQSAYEKSVEKKEISDELGNLLEGRFPTIINPLMRPAAQIRLILFLRSQGFTARNIEYSPLINLGHTAIGTIFNENGIRRAPHFEDQTIDRIWNAYLSIGTTQQRQALGHTQALRLISTQLELDLQTLQRFFASSDTAVRKFMRTKENLTDNERELILGLYKENQSFLSIKEQTGFPFFKILDVLGDDLPEESRPKALDLTAHTFREDPKERDNKIIARFQQIAREQGRVPTASEVSRQSDYSLKVTLKVLKKAGLIEHTSKAKHLNEKEMEQIKAEFKTKRAQGGKSKSQIYREIAEKFGTTFNRIESIFRGIIYSDITGFKRKHHASTAEIQNAYADLSPQEKPNALALLSRQFNCSERQIAEALDDIGVHLAPGSGTKKARRE